VKDYLVRKGAAEKAGDLHGVDPERFAQLTSPDAIKAELGFRQVVQLSVFSPVRTPKDVHLSTGGGAATVATPEVSFLVIGDGSHVQLRQRPTRWGSGQ
jgi:hypothetical protein